MAFLGPVDTVVTKTILPGVTDLVFKNSPTLAYFRKHSMYRYNGGPSWQENFAFRGLKVQAYAPGDTYTLEQRQVATGTTVTPRYYMVGVPVTLEKVLLELNGEHAVFDYIDLQMQEAALTLSARLAVDTFKNGQGARSLFINGLDEGLNDGTTTGPGGSTFATYIGLTRNDANIGSALNSPMTTPAASISAISYPILEQAWASVVYGSERPDLMITTNRGWSYIKMAFQAQQRFESGETDFGFTGIKFNSTVILPDRYAPGSETPSSFETADLGISAITGESLWILNSRHIRFYAASNPLFGFGFTGFLPAQDTSTVVGRYHWAGNLTVPGPRYSRVLFGFTS